jgi:hypothetical protein
LLLHFPFLSFGTFLTFMARLFYSMRSPGGFLVHCVQILLLTLLQTALAITAERTFASSLALAAIGAAFSVEVVDGSPATSDHADSWGCLVEVPVLHVWTWQPLYPQTTTTTFESTTVPTDPDGTHITSIPITTGAVKSDGKWTALTTLSTL